MKTDRLTCIRAKDALSFRLRGKACLTKLNVLLDMDQPENGIEDSGTTIDDPRFAPIPLRNDRLAMMKGLLQKGINAAAPSINGEHDNK